MNRLLEVLKEHYRIPIQLLAAILICIFFLFKSNTKKEKIIALLGVIIFILLLINYLYKLL